MIMALLRDKTALITGGSTGIGLATAKRFVEEGAYVFINGRSQAELDAAVKEIGKSVTGVQGDGSKPGIVTGSTPRWRTLAGAWTSCSPTPRPSTSHGSAKSHESTCRRR